MLNLNIRKLCVASFAMLGAMVSQAECLSGYHLIKEITQGRGGTPTVHLDRETVAAAYSGAEGEQALAEFELFNNPGDGSPWVKAGNRHNWVFRTLDSETDKTLARDRLFSLVMSAMVAKLPVQFCTQGSGVNYVEDRDYRVGSQPGNAVPLISVVKVKPDA